MPAAGARSAARSLLCVLVAASCATGARAALAERCAWPPPAGTASHPDSTNVEVAPLVADLDADGMPEIVVLSFVDGWDDNFGHDGILRILSGADCSEIATVADVGCVSCFGDVACRSLETAAEEGIFCPACTPAIADLDGDGDLEIVLLSETGDGEGRGRRAIILDHRGGFVACTEATSEITGNVAAVALADLESDGLAEILARSVAWRADGPLLWEHVLTGLGATAAADFDGDGILEVTAGQASYRADGTSLWANGLMRGGSPAVADLDLDCEPDLVVTSRNRQTVNLVDPMTGNIRALAPIPAGDCEPRSDGQGGPPTLADVDGDCVPEIGVAGCRRYAMYRYAPGPPEALTLMWESEIDDDTSRFTGSSIFDLDGDGTAEVLYNDHRFLRIFDGLTGAVEAILPNTTNTLMEFPVVADADADGAADVLVTSNDYSFCCDAGVRVLHDDAIPWAPARPLFNQHSYHVTNVLDDGRLPRPEVPSWSELNTYRSQGPALRDDHGPVLAGVPADLAASCAEIPSPATPSATGGCSEAPPVVLGETRVDGPCPGAPTVTRTWTATDRCGRVASRSQVITLVDDAGPVVTEPADVTAECEAPPPPAVTAADACDPAPFVSFMETIVPGPCASEQVVLRTWTASDGCGNATTVGQRVDVVDDGPPVLLGAPADVTVTCTTIPPPATPSASDGCDAAPGIDFEETVEPGPCPAERVLVRTWTATDACGHASSATQRVSVLDDGPPRLIGVPADATVDCGAVPPPAGVTAEDGCDAAPVVTLTEERIDGACAGTYRLVRRWRAVDACGHAAEASQVIDVVDRTPPVVTGTPMRGCIWPPNHWMVCFEPSDFAPIVTDDCSGGVTWRFADCASDQPEDDLGDGAFAPDCILRADGSICVRAERMGTRPEGRHYGLAIVARDACGNESAPARVADLYVPHDQSPHEDCIDPTKDGIKSGGNPRW